jgi:hypothetical protein
MSATRRLAVKLLYAPSPYRLPLMGTPAVRSHDAAALLWRLHRCSRPLDIPLFSLGRVGSGGIRECTIGRDGRT